MYICLSLQEMEGEFFILRNFIFRRDLKYIIFYYLGLVFYSSCEEANFNNNSRVYQTEWVVRIEGGPEVSTLLALRSGYIHMGPVSEFTFLLYIFFLILSLK